ncbi:mmge/prpd family protein-like protein [Thozetella sp. PMI_491]|nr:mmge/prpd family protein-like protein [Thozetella sp. PMI_491]
MTTEHVASWVNSLEFAGLPHDVVQAAVCSWYNWVGCTIGGSGHEAATIAHKSLEPFFGAPTASLLGRRGELKADPQHAALINGIASHVHDYDDTHLDTIIHPTGPVASAILAVAEWKKGVSGKDFLVALVAGIEVECKLGLAVWPEHYDVGWHITSSTGSIGAAVGVAKLLGLPPTQTAQAIGIAATQVVGLREMFGSHTKSFHPGRAAQCGLLAAILAQGGYSSSDQTLEAKRGWANVVGATKVDVQESLRKWTGVDRSEVGLAGSGYGRWEILRNSFKPFPCGIVVHPIIDACVQLYDDLTKLGLSADNISAVTASVHPLVIELTGKKFPKDGLEAKFSVFHGGACGLLFGRATPAEYEDSVVTDARVISLRDRIRAEIDPALVADQARVTVTTDNGKELVKYILHAVGSIEAPMDKGMLQRKFLDQCQNVLGDKAQEASKTCWDIEAVGEVADIIQLLQP